MRARVTIDGVVFVADEWPEKDQRDPVFRCELRPEGTRRPGLIWWFSEGVWTDESTYVSSTRNYLVRVSSVEVESGGVWHREEIDVPLLAHPDPDAEVRCGWIPLPRNGDLGFLAKQLDREAALFGGHGGKSFKTSMSKEGFAYFIVPPFFDPDAPYNRRGCDRTQADNRPSDSQTRIGQDRSTFLGLVLPDDPAPGETGGNALSRGISRWWSRKTKKPVRQSNIDLRTELNASACGSFVDLLASATKKRADADKNFKAAMKKWRFKVFLLKAVLIVLALLGLLLLAFWKFDGARLAKVERLMNEERFAEAEANAPQFFFFSWSRGRLENLLRENGRRRDAFVEQEQERYAEAIRDRRWADALEGAQGLAERAGVEAAAESVGDLDRLAGFRKTADEAARAYAAAVVKRDAEAFRRVAKMCARAVTDCVGIESKDPELFGELRSLAARSLSWLSCLEMEEEGDSGRSGPARELARKILDVTDPLPDQEVVEKAQQVLHGFKTLDDAVVAAERKYDESTVDAPDAYFAALESLSEEYGRDAVLGSVASVENTHFADALEKLSRPFVLAAVALAEDGRLAAARALPPSEFSGDGTEADLARFADWVFAAVGCGLAGTAEIAGWFRYFGLGCDRDENEAESLFRKAREENSGDACYMLAKIAFDRLGRQSPEDDFSIGPGNDGTEEAWRLLDDAESRGVPEAAYVRFGVRPAIVEFDLFETGTNSPGLVFKKALDLRYRKADHASDKKSDREKSKEMLRSVRLYPPAALMLAACDSGEEANLPEMFAFSGRSLPFRRLPMLGLPPPDGGEIPTPYQLEDWLASGASDPEQEVEWFRNASGSNEPIPEASRRFAVFLASGLLDRAGKDGVALIVRAVLAVGLDNRPLLRMFKLAVSRSPSVFRDEVLLQIAENGESKEFSSAVALFPEPPAGNGPLVSRLMESEVGRKSLCEWIAARPSAFSGPDGLGVVVFRTAVRNGDVDLTEALLPVNGVDVNGCVGPNGETPLQLAVSSGDEAVTRLLLKNGADPAFQVDGAPGFFAIVSALGPDGACPTEYIDALVRSNEKFLAQRVGPEKIMPFAWAARSGNVSVLSALLGASGSRIPRETVPRRTALYQAVENGRDVAVQWLCTSFYDPTRDRTLVRSVLKELEKAGLGSVRNRKTIQRFTSESVP